VLNRRPLPFAYSGVQPDQLDRFTRRYAAKGTALVSTEYERGQFLRLGLRADRIPLSVPKPAQPAPEGESQTILFGGSLDEPSAPKQAAWAFDVLKYALPASQLVFRGSGPMLEPVRELSFALGFDDHRVRFEPSDFHSNAVCVWLTQPRGGASSALAALAQGLPELAEYASPGLTLVPAGDRVALASTTLKLLSGPRPVVTPPRFPFAAMVERYAAVYDAMAGAAA
jgi:hypothetical protein